jgi:hypothetical protein
MQIHLLQRLSRGELQARGVRTKPDLGEGPEAIQPFMFEGAKVGWAKSTIENYGRRFEGITVAPAKKDEGRIEAAPVTLRPTSTKRPPGRQSKEAEIERAIKELQESGADLANQPRQKAGHLIREHARDHFGANIKSGYSDPVLQRVLVRLFGLRS